MSDDPAAYQQFLEALATQATAVNLVAASCLTLLIYNHLLTLDQEITQFWPFNCICMSVLRTPMTRIPVIELCSLQLLPALSSPTVCSWPIFELPTATTDPRLNPAVFSIFAGSRFPLQRLQQLFKVILSIGCFFYFGGVVTLIGLVIQDYVGEDVLIDNTLSKLPLPGCYATSVPAIIAGFWIAPLIVETVLVGLVVARAWLWKRRGMNVPPLLAGLARDSTIYYIVPSTTAGCILGSHMLLNLRKMDRSNHPTESQQYGIALSNWRNQATRNSQMPWPTSDPSTSQSDPYFPGGPRVDVKFSTEA
ncbi:hypothetical protein CC1G_11033 [Coprinopsis cinerea okayama7|uniref:Uncharacterized protein n=1 Tax=Coprinopsis cinerea (strain Okayama-7 / 130 / ATCC MYA-4618 / FGSC 9003) TaxID=240176 RepID=A8NIS7_COPC7|nr:hypothetical protein CC1G_11033 [Coprinopsis cinerea okayama7\|eukprot:XP_001834063.2 hypothetical protein CC1G_11033 [Coprinopsis cinerea okayama7\